MQELQATQPDALQVQRCTYDEPAGAGPMQPLNPSPPSPASRSNTSSRQVASPVQVIDPPHHGSVPVVSQIGQLASVIAGSATDASSTPSTGICSSAPNCASSETSTPAVK